jgi:hypothetical protein
MSRPPDPEKKYSRLKKLRCYPKVHEMLCAGYPAPGVADFIQSQGESTDIKKTSLIVALNKYRQDLLPADILSTRMPHVIIQAKKQYTDKLEDLKRMDNIFEALLYQFDALHADYRMTGGLHPAFNQTVREIKDLIYKMHLMKIDLGISGQRNVGSGVVSVERLEEVRQKYGDAAARALQDPVKRTKVMAFWNKISDAAQLKEKEEMLKNSEIIDVESTVVGEVKVE